MRLAAPWKFYLGALATAVVGFGILFAVDASVSSMVIVGLVGGICYGVHLRRYGPRHPPRSEWPLWRVLGRSEAAGRPDGDSSA